MSIIQELKNEDQLLDTIKEGLDNQVSIDIEADLKMVANDRRSNKSKANVFADMKTPLPRESIEGDATQGNDDDIFAEGNVENDPLLQTEVEEKSEKKGFLCFGKKAPASLSRGNTRTPSAKP